MTKGKPAADEAVTIRFDLFELPTAQHKAGLAGLLLQIDHMNGRTPPPPTPRVLERTATSATVEFTAEATQSLFDDLYDAKTVEVKVKSKWAGAKPIREDEVEETVDGKTKRVRLFVYEQTQPTGPFLRQHFQGEREAWHKLWRDMMWAIPRGNPQSREPFEQRAATPPLPCKVGKEVWDDLQRVAKARAKNGFHTGPVAGSLWLGAQAANAEAIPFEGRADQTLLLNFWPLSSQVFVPAVLKVEREPGKVEVKSEFVGYVLAIPEVSDLDLFLADYPAMLGNLRPDVRGFRPAEAVIDLPAEAALSFLAHLGTKKAMMSEARFGLGSVDYLHQVKVGNNIKTQAAGRVTLRRGLLETYQRIVGRPGEKARFANPLFRRGALQALIDEEPWYRPFGRLFAEWPAEFFVNSEASPKKLPWFWADARKKFQEVFDAMPTDPRPTDPPSDDHLLAATVHRLVRRYLDARLEKEAGHDFAKYREQKSTPPEAAADRRKLAERLFLEFRSRRDQAFIDHFSGTFFSVGQYLGPKPVPRLFERVAEALMRRTEDVKTLTLMALSANSWVPMKKKEVAK